MPDTPGPRARESLTNMLRVLEALPPEQHFDLRHWAGFVDEEGNTSPYKDDVDHPCGTTACACGYAALDPWFQQQGLTLRDNVTGQKITSIEAFNASLKTSNGYGLCFGTADYESQFFGLTLEGFDALFHHTTYSRPTRHNVIHRIRAVLNNPDTARSHANPFFTGD